jgi:glycerol-3-phosphate dehydrogenase
MLNDREKLWQQLATANTQWDMIIVGGGITGAGVLHEAAKNGWKTLLIEQRDFAWGTSSRSSKMVHGGLRYLAQGDLKLTKQALNERERLLTELPGLVDRMGYYLMLKRGKFPGRWAMGLALRVYDAIAGIKHKDHRHHYYNRAEILKRFPGIEQRLLTGASYYTDAVTDDARLVLRILHEAVRSGAKALNYAKARSITQSEDLQQLSIENVETGECLTLQATVVVNATGAWVDRLRDHINNEKRVRPLRGSHLVIEKNKLPLNEAILLYHPWDNRPVFMCPWEGATIIGTTDLDHAGELDNETSITTAELDYLLAIVKHQFPHNDIQYRDIISTFSGVRPVIGSDNNKDPSKERRDHALWCDGKLISVSGGKLTTFQLIANEVVDVAKQWLKVKTSSTEQNRMARLRDLKEFDHHLDLRKFFDNDTARSKRLLGRYGKDVMAVFQHSPSLERKKIATTQYCLAECRWSLKNEAVLHLDDLLLRRTRLGLLLHNGAEQLFDTLQDLCCGELNWDTVKWQEELHRYKKIIRQHYSLPEKSP